MAPVIVSPEQEILALKQALRSEREQRNRITKERDSLAGELRVTRTERDLLKERLNKFLRKLFAARSEALANQKVLFFNEAEAEAGGAQIGREHV